MRQEQILDAAISVLGTSGVRQLTHRAVDARAGLASGSTSNYYRTRDALVVAVVRRFAERERTIWERMASSVDPRSLEELAAALDGFLRQATGLDQEQTLARFAILVEAALHPEAQRYLGETMAEIRTWGARWLARIGSPDPTAHCAILFDCLNGMLLRQIAFPERGFDPRARLVTLLSGLVRR